ncbi:uncharacterized protein LOC135819712 [Sycon ciliatum]|uniref:uncharacterized protein LOC135819712 n=1 Tax=Sycon ciliatum TaxID=27933 RepID=UPI0020A90821|eukprot:scpid83606/ scgid15596/ 
MMMLPFGPGLQWFVVMMSTIRRKMLPTFSRVSRVTLGLTVLLASVIFIMYLVASRMNSDTPRHPSSPLAQRNNREQKACKGILLVVIFNFPYFKNVPMLRDMYGDTFSKVVFFADESDEALDVHAVALEKGYFQHRAVSAAMLMYPGYDGYLWTGDDVLLDPYKMLSTLNMDQLWLAGYDDSVYCVEDGTKPACTHHEHWDGLLRNGERSSKEDTGAEGRTAARLALARLPAPYRKRSRNALRCEDCFLKGPSDVGYVPRAKVSEFLLTSLFFHDIFFEFAVPTMFLLLAPGRSNMEVPAAFYSWAKNPDERFNEVATSWKSGRFIFVHPVKLSVPVQRESAFKWLAQAKLNSRWSSRNRCT